MWNLISDMSVEESHLFELINFASFENGHKLSSSAFSESKNFIYGFVILDNKKLNFCHLLETPLGAEGYALTDCFSMVT